MTIVTMQVLEYTTRFDVEFPTLFRHPIEDVEEMLVLFNVESWSKFASWAVSFD